MKSCLLVAGALAVGALAAPATAQYRGAEVDMIDRFEDERFAIDARERRGALGPEEAARFRDEIEFLRRLERRYARDGLDPWERGDLRRRLVLLRDGIRYAEQGYAAARRDDPWYRPAEPGGYGSDPYDFEPEDDGDYDRDARWDDDRYYDPADDMDVYAAERPPAASLPRTERWERIDPNDALAQDETWNEEDFAVGGPDEPLDEVEEGGPIVWPSEPLRVGNRAPVNLQPVPAEHRGRYSDTEAVYYRYDRGRVFQIDRRTDTIRWIGELP